MIIPERIARHLEAALRLHAGRCVAVFGIPLPAAASAWAGGACERILIHQETATVQALNALPRVEVAIAMAPLANGQEHIVARLRDLIAERVLLVESAPPGRLHEIDARIRSLAFTRIAGSVVDAEHALLLYGYDIATYKRTPDWLTARHWANPELWDRHRW